MQRRSRVLVLVPFGLIGIVALVSFAINFRAMLLLDQAFSEGTNWITDFERITQFMITRVIFPYEGNLANLHDMDFFKLTASYVGANNNIVLWLALIEVALVNFLPWLRRMPKLRISATICFGVVALASPIISRLSESYGGF